MRQRHRKLAGIFACTGFLIIYCLAAMAIGGALVVGRHPAAELAFYAAAGFAWLPPVMLVIRWMSRADAA